MYRFIKSSRNNKTKLTVIEEFDMKIKIHIFVLRDVNSLKNVHKKSQPCYIDRDSGRFS